MVLRSCLYATDIAISIVMSIVIAVVEIIIDINIAIITLIVITIITIFSIIAIIILTDMTLIIAIISNDVHCTKHCGAKSRIEQNCQYSNAGLTPFLVIISRMSVIWISYSVSISLNDSIIIIQHTYLFCSHSTT